MENIYELVEENFNEVVNWRRHIHKYPELSFEEHNTSKFIYEKLTEFGLDEVEYMCGTAVIGLLKGTAGEGKCIALRADIDALPVKEQNEYEFKSQIEGLMHACGHDGHVAMLLGTAKILTKMRSKLKGSVKFIFQHGEEKFPGGAKPLVEAGVMENPHVDAIMGAHIVPHEKSGVIRAKAGAVSIGCDLANITITGKSGHASKPHLADDALLAACEYVTSLQRIVSRSIDPRKTGIVSVGTLNAGTAVNIVSDHAKLSLNARFFDNESREIIRKKLNDIADGIGTVSNCEFDIEYIEGYEAVVNDESIVELVKQATNKYLGPELFEEEEYDLGSDDFSYFMNATNTPGAYFFLLSGHEGDEIYNNHHPLFSWKEEAMKNGMIVYIGAVLDYLKDNNK